MERGNGWGGEREEDVGGGCTMQHWMNDLLHGGFLEISGRGEEKWKQETGRKEWKFQVRCKSGAAIASPLLYGCHVFKGQLIATCHHTAWDNSEGFFFFFFSSCYSPISDSRSVGQLDAGGSAVAVDFRLEGESLVDNDSHCSFGLGSGSLGDDS